MFFLHKTILSLFLQSVAGPKIGDRKVMFQEIFPNIPPPQIAPPATPSDLTWHI